MRRRADDIEKSILPHLLRTRNDVSSDWWGMCRARRTILQKRALIRIPEPSGIGLFLSEEERRSFRKPRRSVLSPGIRHYKRPQGLKRQMLDEKVGAVNAYDLKLLGYTGTFKPPGKQDWIPYMNSISRLHAVGGVAEKLADDQHVNKEWLQFTG